MKNGCIAITLIALSCARGADGVAAQEPIVGLPCDGCEAVFEGLPQDRSTIPAQARIGSAEEPGEPLVLSGVVRTAEGKPVSGIIVYAYHTDRGGIYPRHLPSEPAPGHASGRHGRLRAFARTGADGGYRFITIRPGGYPNSEIPQHVHMHVLEPGSCAYYIDEVVFDDDPRLTASERRQLITGRAGDGLVVPTRDAAGTWQARRDVVLGAKVPGYEACGRVR